MFRDQDLASHPEGRVAAPTQTGDDSELRHAQPSKLHDHSHAGHVLVVICSTTGSGDFPQVYCSLGRPTDLEHLARKNAAVGNPCKELRDLHAGAWGV